MKGFAFSSRFFGLAVLLGLSSALAVIPNTISFLNAFVNGTTGVTFARPVFFAPVPGKDSTYVILEQQRGNAIILHRKAGAWVKDTLMKQTVVANQNEMGFLSVAFHPNFAINHKFYVFYSKNGTNCPATSCGLNVVEERQTDSTLIKDAGITPRTLLSISKSAMNHNGGDIDFGNDGYLYIGTGDGGDPQGDPVSTALPVGRGQKTDTLLGKILRIDVNTTSGSKLYGIPADNPFVNNSAYLPEIYALGVRNPWRWSFDRVTGNMWVGEVGNSTREEIDTVAKGANLGWRLMEGFACQPSVTCNAADPSLTLPIAAYPHSGGDTSGTAVVGGYVYRGNPASPYYGLYFYGDNGSSQVWVIRKGTNGRIAERITLHPTPTATTTPAVTALTAFGEDAKGNLYALGLNTGIVYLLSSPDLQPSTVSISDRHAKAFSPMSLHDLSNMDLRNLQGRKVSGSALHNGVYVTQRPGDNAPALVPVLK